LFKVCSRLSLKEPAAVVFGRRAKEHDQDHEGPYQRHDYDLGIGDIETMADEVAAWNATRHRARNTVRWQFTKTDAHRQLHNKCSDRSGTASTTPPFAEFPLFRGNDATGDTGSLGCAAHVDFKTSDNLCFDA
jgi:hypothetical protein